LWREENRRTQGKTLGARTRTNNKTQAALMGGEVSHHCSIPASRTSFTLDVWWV